MRRRAARAPRDVARRVEAPRLRPRDLRLQAVDGRRGKGEPEVGGDLGEEPVPVGGEHRGRLASCGADLSEQLEGGAVERARAHPLDTRGVEARAQLARRLAGEGGHEDVARVDALLGDASHDALGEHARLARAGARAHDEAPVGSLDGLELLGREAERVAVVRARHARNLPRRGDARAGHGGRERPW